MTLLKFNFKRIVFCSSLLVILSCSKEDSCTPKPIKQNILGHWQITSNLNGYSESGTGSFESNGKFATIPKDLILSTNVFGSSVLTNNEKYFILGSEITFSANVVNSNLTTFYIVTIFSNECTKIILKNSVENRIITLYR